MRCWKSAIILYNIETQKVGTLYLGYILLSLKTDISKSNFDKQSTCLRESIRIMDLQCSKNMDVEWKKIWWM